MSLMCLNACRGKITTGKPGRQKYWEGDEYACPKCGAEYVIGVTDDFESDSVAYLIPKDESRARARKEAAP